MRRRAWSLVGFLVTLLVAIPTRAACVIVEARDSAAPLATLDVDGTPPQFILMSIHSVTRTPVVETFDVVGTELVERELRFVEHGPGLPTAPDADRAFERRDGAFVMRGDRTFESLAMRVDADQHPMLVTGTRAIELAGLGRRALTLRAVPAACGPARDGS